MRRFSCEDLALGFACDRILEAETDEELLEQALAHARDEHGAEEIDRDYARAAIVGSTAAPT